MGLVVTGTAFLQSAVDGHLGRFQAFFFLLKIVLSQNGIGTRFTLLPEKNKEHKTEAIYKAMVFKMLDTSQQRAVTAQR